MHKQHVGRLDKNMAIAQYNPKMIEVHVNRPNEDAPEELRIAIVYSGSYDNISKRHIEPTETRNYNKQFTTGHIFIRDDELSHLITALIAVNERRNEPHITEGVSIPCRLKSNKEKSNNEPTKNSNEKPCPKNVKTEQN